MDLLELLQNEELEQEEFDTTLSHGIYVSNLAYHLALEAGLSREICDEMAVAGMLHDIGKIRASKLMYVEQGTDNLIIKQMNYLRQHPFFGYEAVKAEGYSSAIQESILFHHENYDGSGYPSNLFGDMIPLGARILRICDVFAALTTKKAYRPAHDANAALELMICDVQKYDMRLFLCLMNMVNDMDVIRTLKKNLI